MNLYPVIQSAVDKPWFIGVMIVSGFCGAIGSFVFYFAFSKLAGIPTKFSSRSFLCTDFLTGVLERFFFTILIYCSNTGIASAAIAWIAIKGQVHYKIFSPEKNQDLLCVYRGILGSISSLFFGIIGGYIWIKHKTFNKIEEMCNANFSNSILVIILVAIVSTCIISYILKAKTFKPKNEYCCDQCQKSVSRGMFERLLEKNATKHEGQFIDYCPFCGASVKDFGFALLNNFSD